MQQNYVFNTKFKMQQTTLFVKEPNEIFASFINFVCQLCAIDKKFITWLLK